MKKPAAIVGSAVFLVIAPGLVAVLAPRWISQWSVKKPFFGSSFFASGGDLQFWELHLSRGTLIGALQVCGAVLIALGSVGIIDCFRRFAVEGLGTPAPGFLPGHLIVTGLYRYVRNPMYVAVTSAIVGQALIFGDLGLLEYAGVVWALFYLWIMIYEEPTLKARFGNEYKTYCANVGRWIPRLTPWAGAMP
jgi:protein-S-isoprenylcysteine O-methyltransferase Ste14